jgi:hypothetical protein
MPPPAGRLPALATVLVILATAVAWLPPERGRTRENPDVPDVCVLSPRVEADAAGLARAAVPVSTPTIFVRDPLTQVRILRGTMLLWQRQASAGEPIEGPIQWPLAPLRAGERLTLQLQPVGAGTTDFASIELQAAAAEALTRNDRLLARLGDDPARWQAAVQRARQQSDLPLTSALLFAYEGPSREDLNALRLLVIERSCGAVPTP